MYDFDTQIDRKHTESTKWDRLRLQYQDEDLLPLWLADMDFPVSSAIQEALIARAQHPIYGYTDRGPMYPKLFADRFNERFQYDIKPEQVILSTGVMYSISAAIRLFTKEGDGILIPRPCYHPFVDMTVNNDRVPIFTEMLACDDGYVFDFEAMEKAAEKACAFLLCNPHNPTGRVFQKEELQQLAELCERHQLLIISDEIHSDFVYPGNTFVPMMNISAYTKEHTVACVAPTKAFNLAGIKISAAFIKNEEMKQKFQRYAATTGISSINLFAMEALKAAYGHSSQWQKELLAYLSENRRITEEVLKQYKTQLTYTVPEGTYFYWINFHDPKIHSALLKHHLALNAGSEFSDDCAGYARMNIACPRALLRKGLQAIQEVVTERSSL